MQRRQQRAGEARCTRLPTKTHALVPASAAPRVCVCVCVRRLRSRRPTTSWHCSGTPTATQHRCACASLLWRRVLPCSRERLTCRRQCVLRCDQSHVALLSCTWPPLVCMCALQEATAKFQALQRIYDVLSDPAKRVCFLDVCVLIAGIGGCLRCTRRSAPLRAYGRRQRSSRCVQQLTPAALAAYAGASCTTVLAACRTARTWCRCARGVRLYSGLYVHVVSTRL
jgi:hypothetical protein